MNYTFYSLVKYPFRRLSVLNNSLLNPFLRSRPEDIRVYCVATMSSDAAEKSWRGVPLSEVYGGQSPWDAPEFPAVSPSSHHAVLYHIPSYGLTDDTPLHPQIGHDMWDSEHVRLPCSKHSLYKVEDRNGETHLKNRWEIIEAALRRPIRNSYELAEAILTYNTKFKGAWKFRAMHKLFNEHLDEDESEIFFSVTLPEIAKLALDLPKLIQAPIPLLKQHRNQSISLTQQQIASLLANAFFCTFPRRNTYKRSSEYALYPAINMTGLFESSGADHVLEKLKCICFYFRTVCKKVSVGVVTYSRRSVPLRRSSAHSTHAPSHSAHSTHAPSHSTHAPAPATSHAPLAATPLHVDTEHAIEDAHGLIQLDFANKYLGGGVLNHGCVQEEIRFVICPELMASMLFTEVLRPNEAVMIIGAERYSEYSGYGHTFQWRGRYCDTTPRDKSLRRRVAVLCIDALPSNNPRHEYTPEAIEREFIKAWVGFSFFTGGSGPGLNYPGLATGNWGCGAFGGTPQLKALIQLMAAAAARRPLAYYTFDDLHIRDYLVEMYDLLARRNVTVGQLYNYLIQYHEEGATGDFPTFLRRLIEAGPDSNKTTPKTSTNFKQNDKATIDGKLAFKFTPKKSSDVKPSDKNTSIVASDVPITVPSTNWTVTENSKCDETQDKMETSTSSQEYVLSSEVEREFLKDSPDLFSDDEMTGVTIIKNSAGPVLSELHISQASDKQTKPSKLIDAMQKLDDQSGLKLSSTSASPIKPNTSVIDNVSNDSIDTPIKKPKKEQTERPTPKNNRLITDFFSKKPT